ncbi:hypothetical protein HNS30_38200, partial [Corallococcus exercitus]|nr:hypothetical protein [Corallococcus exercitus]
MTSGRHRPSRYLLIAAGLAALAGGFALGACSAWAGPPPGPAAGPWERRASPVPPPLGTMAAGAGPHTFAGVNTETQDEELDDPRLQRDGFDAARFRRLLARYQRGELTASRPLEGGVRPLRAGDLRPLPAEGTPEHDACRARGEE